MEEKFCISSFKAYHAWNILKISHTKNACS